MKSEQTMATELEHSSSNQTNPTLYDKLIEPILDTTICGLFGAVFGGTIGMVIIAPMARGYPRFLPPLSRTQYARMHAQESAAVGAALIGTESIMSGIRGKDDLTNHLVAGSGGGLALSLVRHGLKVKPALSWAAYFTVLWGTLSKVIGFDTYEANDNQSQEGPC